MADWLKKYLLGFAFFLFIFLCLFSQTSKKELKELEARLQGSNGKERLEILVKLTKAYSDTEPKKALQYGQEAEELMRTVSFPGQQVPLLNAISAAYTYLGEYETAEKYANQGLEIAKKSGDQLGYAGALFRLGFMNFDRGTFSQGIDYLTKSLAMFEELGDLAGAAKSLNAIGLVYWKLNDHTRALEYFIDAGKLYEKLGNKIGIAFIYNNSGNINAELKNYHKALDYYNKTLHIFRELDDKNRTAIVINNIARVYFYQEKYKEALKLYKESLKIAEELDIKKHISRVINNMGNLYEITNELPQALKCFSDALKIRETIGDLEGIAETLISLGRLKRKLHQYREALLHINRAIAIASEIKAKAATMSGYEELSGILAAQKDYQGALTYYKKFKELNDEIFNEDNSKKIAEMQTRFDLERKEKEITLLKKDNSIQQLNLDKQENIKNSFIIITGLVLVLAFVIYARYRLKRKANQELEKANQTLKEEILQHQQTTRKLEESEEKFRALAEKSVVGIYIIQENQFKYVNPKFLDIFGYFLDEIIGEHPLKMVFTEDRPLVSANIQQRLSGKESALHHEFRGLTKDGLVIHLESFGTRVNYQGEPAIMGSLIDVTDRKKATAELMKGQKLESIGILAGGIAHDFNNLLTVITGNLAMAIDDIKDDTHIIHMLKSAEKSSQQAAELTQKLITFSKGGWLDLEEVSLSSVLKSTMEFYPNIKPLLESASLSIPPGLMPIYGDERQLRQVIYSLLENARESVTDGIQITIKAQNITLPQAEAGKLSLKEGNYVRVSIIDNGKGIPPDLLDYIFDPYMSTKDMVTQKGLGLGLAICYSIVKKHQGHITVESEVGKGTTVTLHLPAFSAVPGK